MIRIEGFTQKSQDHTQGITLLIDSCEYVRGLKTYKCHLLLDYEDMNVLKDTTTANWLFYYYSSSFFQLFAILFLATTLKKDLVIYVKYIELLKIILRSSHANLTNLKIS